MHGPEGVYTGYIRTVHAVMSWDFDAFWKLDREVAGSPYGCSLAVNHNLSDTESFRVHLYLVTKF